MKNFILVLVCITFYSCHKKNQTGISIFNDNSLAKRIKFENDIYQLLNDFNDGNLKKLYNSLSEDESFISLYSVKHGDVYYSNSNYKIWNFVNYQYYKELIDADSVEIKYSLGLLAYGHNMNNGVSVTNTPPVSQSIDSVICFEYNIDEFSPVLYIFFDNKKIKRPDKAVPDDKITAKSSSYTTGNYILIDTISGTASKL